MKTKNTHLSPVDQIFKNEQGVAHQQIDEIYFAGQYRRLSFSSRKTKRTNLRAVVNVNIKMYKRGCGCFFGLFFYAISPKLFLN